MPEESPDLLLADDGHEPLMVVFCAQPEVSRGMERALRKHYVDEGFDAKIVESCEAARSLLRGDRDVAMLIAEQTESSRQALDLVSDARELQPDARTVVMTPHSAMRPALDALGTGTLDHLFIEPIGSLEEEVFPVLTGLLEDWRVWRQKHEGRAVHVVGPRRDPESHVVCDFLARNVIQHRFIDADAPVGRVMLEEAGASAEQLPVVLLEGGERLARPSMLDLANALNLATSPEQGSYDLIVIGGGPAGLGAAVYGSSEGLSTLLLETDAPGGQAGQSSRIENYLGFPGGLKGGELAQRALFQARRFGTEVVRLSDATALRCAGGGAKVGLADGTELGCRAAVIATGVTYRRLEAPGIEGLLGRGVYYGAAATDAQSYLDRRVFIVGGANSAGQAALHFAKHAGAVTMLVRADSLEARMSRYLVERIEEADKIEVLTGTEVTGASGEDGLEGLTLSPVGGGESREVPADVMFVFIGAMPHTDWLSGVARDERGFILTGREIDRERAGWRLERDPMPLETSLPGVFAAGDVRHGSIKRVASAVGEGAMAVQLVHDYVAEQDGLAER